MDALSWEEATFVTESMPGDAPAPRPTLRTVAACAVYSLSLLSTWLLNSTAYPGFNDFFPMARDVATVFGALFAFVLAFAAMRRPRVLASGGFLVLCVARCSPVSGPCLSAHGSRAPCCPRWAHA